MPRRTCSWSEVTAIERLLAFAAAAAESLPPALAGPIVAIGWGTVELDRAAEELGRALGIDAARFVPAPDCEVLGARCRLARDGLPGGPALVLLEPSTEGRLAATLARNDEGPAAIWVTPLDPTAATGDATSSTSAGQPGPLGSERLVLSGPAPGPHRLLVLAPGTIGT